MGLVEKTITRLAPQMALNREIARQKLDLLQRVTNSGYSEGGASTRKRSTRGWTARSGSPTQDIDYNLQTLRERSRDLYMNGAIGRSAISTIRTNVVGPGLKLKSRIDAKYIGMTEEQADEWERNTEREFAIWADSLFCDSTRLNNFYELQQIAQAGWLMNGDAFCLFKQDKVFPWMPYSLRLHLIEADRISSPNSFLPETKNQSNGNRIISGIELDSNGAVVAYHICSKYPYELTSSPAAWTRVETFGSRTGEPNILHLMECERAEQHRGVPLLSPVIESLKQVTRYTEAELMAAVVSGMFTVFIKSESPDTDQPVGSMIPVEQQIAPNESVNYEMGPGAINILGPGESIESADPNRPNSNFGGFIDALCSQIGAALEIPKDLLLKQFNASYSASRAALLEAWKMFRMRRTWLASDFCQPIYERWLSEAIARGRIKAPGYFNDVAMRKAWSAAEWNGPAQGQLDPQKEVTAAVTRINNGLSTRERETMELTGGDFDRNITQLQRENKLMQTMGVNINAVQQTNADAGTGDPGAS